MEWNTKESFVFEDLLEIMRILRKECPWDKKQTHLSLLEPLIEESYELKQAILNQDLKNTEEELGDVLLQVVFHTTIGQEEGHYDINSVITELCKKMIRRHPHVFKDTRVENEDQVLDNWDAIKLQEKKQKTQTESMLDVPDALPALIKAYKVQKKAAKVGFDWDHVDGIYKKIEEELAEVKDAKKNGSLDDIEEEIGDLIFSTVNLARFFEINPEFALTNAIEKFINRFRYIEYFATQTGKSLEDFTLDELNSLWERAKSCT